MVRHLGPDSWGPPTPSEVTVRELVGHVVVGNRISALLLADVAPNEARAMLTGDQLGPVGLCPRVHEPGVEPITPPARSSVPR